MLFSRILDSSLGISYGKYEAMAPLDQQYQLFASSGAIKFPVPKSEAWTEKVNFHFPLSFEILI